MRGLTGCGRELVPRRFHLIILSVLLETLPVWLRAHRLGGNVVVRCAKGHLFTTLWIPGASVKSIRLGFWRIQHCPVGHHWSIVTPANVAELSRAERHTAREHHDIRVP